MLTNRGACGKDIWRRLASMQISVKEIARIKWNFGLVGVLFAVSLLTVSSAVAGGQTNISGDVSGTVTDRTGAAIPNATITITSSDTGDVKTATSNGSGNFHVPFLKPGKYKITGTSAGFTTTSSQVDVTAGTTASIDMKLTVGAGSTTVEVTSEESLMHTESAQLSTTFNLAEIQALPNPGNDLTFVAQTTPGAVMNTQGGYGNFSVFGLPATSNTFTVNGGYENDPYLNVNNSGATNLLLGNNDISQVSVTTNAYDVSFGGLGGAQVNQISRSGANGFHGNANYWWNGRVMNANNWFNNFNGTPRPFDNVNQWATAIGGPIVKDKTFFFVNYEGLRVILPTRATIYVPSPAYQKTTLASIPAAEVPLYTSMFKTWQATPGYASATVDPSDANALDINGIASNFTHEYLITGRVDQTIGKNDLLYAHFKIDKGVQATFTSLINPLFNTLSAQPQYEGQLNETHTFTPALTNQFLFTASYYRAIFSNSNQAAANAIAPFALVFLTGQLSQNPVAGFMGGENYAFPQGRNVTGYQFQDDLSWSKGKHTIKGGWSMRRDDVTDYSPSVRAVTPEAYTTEAAFQIGNATRYRQNFPVRKTQPVALYTMGAYIQDQWKMQPNFVLTIGMRFEHNSNPVCRTSCFADMGTNFLSLAASTSTSTPYNQQIQSGLYQAFHSFQAVGYEPRIGFAWQPFGLNKKTTVRGGFGIFSDSFPAQIAGDLLNNAPSNVQFYLRSSGFLLDPTLPGSGGQATAASNKAFTAGYSSGASYATLHAAGIGFVAPSFTLADPKVSYPTYEEYSLAVEYQLPKGIVVAVNYVGNHGYKEPVVSSGINAYGFGSLPAAAPSGSFGQVSEVYSGASSNYNGLALTATRRSPTFSFQFNYMYGHALDEISNGGFNGFSGDPENPNNPYNLHQNYGNADYDTRNYISANYVVNIPHFGGPRILTDGWQIAGTVFHNTGYPFTYVDSAIPSNYVGTVYAQQTGKGFPTHCSGVKSAATSGGIPCGAQSNFFTFATGFNQQHRNQLYGPNYTDSDLDLTKKFKIPHWESASLNVGAQFFNVFNHPNFGLPLNDVEGGDPNSGFGVITSTVNTPTSILGSFLGGDASPRLVQLKAGFTF
jgi:hypothetical protein